MTKFFASAALLIAMTGAALAGTNHQAFAPTGDISKAPMGWSQFCADTPKECDGDPVEARNIVLSDKAFTDLQRVNDWVNENVQPMTDMDHWGVIEKWSIPVADDMHGDCEDYVLLKRKMLIDAGWSRSALLITVVRDQKGEGHAVLTVKSDKGDFILDNQNEKIVLWSETGYRFIKRQSQANQNEWVAFVNSSMPMVSALHK